jgi:hypothetical protein
MVAGRQCRQHRAHRSSNVSIACICLLRPEVSWHTALTVVPVLTLVPRFPLPELILIVRVPARPSRLKDTSIPSTRRKVCARRNRPERAPGFFGQPAPERSSAPRSLAARKSSEAVPAQLPRSATSLRTQTATGSLSMTSSIADLRFAS